MDTCDHSDGWTERGMGDDRWEECWLCGAQRELNKKGR